MSRIRHFFQLIPRMYSLFWRHPEYRGEWFTWLYPLWHAWVASQ
jgi:hypothetical protein